MLHNKTQSQSEWQEAEGLHEGGAREGVPHGNAEKKAARGNGKLALQAETG